MRTKMIALFALCVMLGAVMLACGGAATDNANTATTNSTANANAKAAASPAASPAATATTTASAGEKIGVAECDEFITKYEACVKDKVPANMQATFNTSLAQWRSSWKKLADNPATKGTLAAACKQSMDTAKSSLSSYNCAW